MENFDPTSVGNFWYSIAIAYLIVELVFWALRYYRIKLEISFKPLEENKRKSQDKSKK